VIAALGDAEAQTVKATDTLFAWNPD